MTAPVLSNAPDALAAVGGRTLVDRLLLPKILLDAPRLALPWVLSDRGRPRLFVRHMEAPNLAGYDVAPVAYHTPYFTWDGPPPGVARSLVDALTPHLDGQRVLLDPASPAVLYDELAQLGLDVTARRPRHVTVRPIDLVEAARGRHRHAPALAAAARRVAAALRDGTALVRWLDVPGDDAIAVLDALLAAARLDGVLLTSPLATGELCGMVRPQMALYAGGRAWAIGADGSSPDGTRYPSLEDALSTIAPGAVLGYEEGSLHVGAWLALRDRVPMAPASATVRTWMDRRAGRCLGAYLLAAVSALHGIERASDRLRARLDRDGAATEQDVAAWVWEGIEACVPWRTLPVQPSPYFVIVHAAARTLLPGLATDARIAPSGTLKFDIGVILRDGDGQVYGCSDIARTLSFSEHGRAGTAVLEDIMDLVRPRLVATATGDEIWRASVDALEARTPTLRANGLLPPGAAAGQLGRDTGHALGRQSVSACYFLPGVDSQLAAGMVACLEYVWLYRDMALAFEDAFAVTPEGPLNITR